VTVDLSKPAREVRRPHRDPTKCEDTSTTRAPTFGFMRPIHPCQLHLSCVLLLGIAACATSAPPGKGHAASSGSASASQNAAEVASAPGGGEFRLLWQDDFDKLDSSRWQLMTHSWDGNLAQFSTRNTKFENGLATLLLTRDSSDPNKPFRGVEMRSIETITYGKVEARARFAKGSGVVSALVLIYTPWPADDWNELDIEYLGRYSGKVQFNAQVYTGPPVAKPARRAVKPEEDPEMVSLGIAPSADFHVYGIEWTPTVARFLVDGEVKRTWSSQIARMKLPQNILLTIWASGAEAWAGPIKPSSVPTTADFDWLRVYKWVPGNP
jgi:beta-glucanase (GH16 family)